MSYDLLIQGKHKITKLRRLVGLFFKIDPRGIGSVYDGENHDVNIEKNDVRGDFHTRLCVYKSEHILPDVKEVDFAIFLSHDLKEEVLMTYWDNNPYVWILVEPDGHLYKVIDIPDEEESENLEGFFLQLDKNFREKLNLDDVREKSGY